MRRRPGPHLPACARLGSSPTAATRSAHGVFGTIYDVGDALGPIAAGVLVATVGYAPMFQTLAVVGFTMAVMFLLTSRADR
jgi:sugar phosphate permease